jgi:hypothetical protein
MRPLLFVNWRQVSQRFTMLMWLLAAVLAVVVLVHAAGDPAPAPAATNQVLHFHSAGMTPPPLHSRP